MKRHLLCLLCSSFLFAGGLLVEANAQAAAAQAHVAAAKAVASEPGLYDLTPTFTLLCAERKPRVQDTQAASRPANGERRAPLRSEWYVEPVKVFDNLLNVGTSFYVWAVTTSDGIILLNSGRDYAAEAVVEGLQEMGLDPAAVKYVIVHNADPAHYGAAKLFQDRYHSRILLSEADWNVIAKTPDVPERLKPRKDMVVTDGQKLTLGDTTLTLYVTPGNTPGTLSTLVPLRDGNQRHLGVLIGGRDWDVAEQGVVYFSSEEEAIKTWIASANRLRDIVAKANVDVFLSVRSLYDQELEKARVLKLRKPGDPHPYVNKKAVDRYLNVIRECMDAQLAWRRR
jgi:metallo-beta-lactamase class B